MLILIQIIVEKGQNQLGQAGCSPEVEKNTAF